MNNIQWFTEIFEHVPHNNFICIYIRIVCLLYKTFWHFISAIMRDTIVMIICIFMKFYNFHYSPHYSANEISNDLYDTYNRFIKNDKRSSCFVNHFKYNKQIMREPCKWRLKRLVACILNDIQGCHT